MKSRRGRPCRPPRRPPTPQLRRRWIRWNCSRRRGGRSTTATAAARPKSSSARSSSIRKATSCGSRSARPTPAPARRPGRLDYQQRVARTMIAAGKRADAEERAAEVVRELRASPESLDLLKEVYKDGGGDAAVVEALQKLHREKPDDHTFLFALTD